MRRSWGTLWIYRLLVSGRLSQGAEGCRVLAWTPVLQGGARNERGCGELRCVASGKTQEKGPRWKQRGAFVHVFNTVPEPQPVGEGCVENTRGSEDTEPFLL